MSIKEFEMKYHEIESSLKNTPKLANRKSCVSCNIDETVINSNVSVANDCCTRDDQNIVKSDEFRIRKLASSETISGVDNAALLRRQIFDQAVLIFPSVFKNIAGTTEHTPYIVIRPSYFDNASDEEQFLAFTAHNGDQDSFLTFTCTSGNNTSSKWWRRISSNTDTVEKSYAPLSSFLTARLEWAALESFLEFEFNKKTHLEELLIVTSFSDGHEMGALDGESRSKNHLLSILGDILSHCRALNDLALTIDSATLSSFAAPLFATCLQLDGAADRLSLNNFQDVILTPFSWILRAVEGQSSVDLQEIDQAINLSLQRMDQHKPETNSMLSANTSDDGRCVFDGVNDLKRHNDHTPQSKKKKKNKKKKVRRAVVLSFFVLIASHFLVSM